MSLELTGRTERHLCDEGVRTDLGAYVHAEVVEPFRALRSDAQRAGFDLRILSGFRSFDRQLSIWNRKAEGELAVLDSSAEPLDITTLTGAELVMAILRWSALPGASRHHWGTDLDVFDGSAVPDGYEIELIPEEVDSGGMFGPFHEWLDERMRTDTAYGFTRPYDEDRGGVAPERWHLSYAPVAVENLRALTPSVLREVVQTADLRLQDHVLSELDHVYERFVVNVADHLR